MVDGSRSRYHAIMSNPIENHYTTADLLERIFAALVMGGKNPYALRVDDLSRMDEFHTRGRHATRELAELGAISADSRVLDVGCGIGGSARFLAHKYSCQVTGIDLTAAYVQAADRLTHLTGLDNHCCFLTGEATRLPFNDAEFDVVWTEHAQMNVSNKEAFYKEAARVLKPSGRFLFYDVFAGKETPQFPTPWADQAGISFLISQDSAISLMKAQGLNVDFWQEKQGEAIAALKANTSKLASDEAGSLPALGPHLLMGENATEKITNHLYNLETGKITLVMGCAVKSVC